MYIFKYTIPQDYIILPKTAEIYSDGKSPNELLEIIVKQRKLAKTRIIYFENYTQLVNYFSGRNDRFPGENPLFSKIGHNPNDSFFTRCSSPYSSRNFLNKYVAEWYPCYILRDATLTNEFGTPVLNPKFKYDVTTWKFSPDIEKQRQKFQEKYKKSMNYKKPRYYTWRYGIPKSAYPEFRRGPMPDISCQRYRYNSCRPVKIETPSTKLDRFETEETGFPINKIHEYRDYFSRDWRNDGWKSQRKGRKSWDRNKKGDKVKYNKRHEIKVDFKALNEELCG